MDPASYYTYTDADFICQIVMWLIWCGWQWRRVIWCSNGNGVACALCLAPVTQYRNWMQSGYNFPLHVLQIYSDAEYVPLMVLVVIVYHNLRMSLPETKFNSYIVYFRQLLGTSGVYTPLLCLYSIKGHSFHIFHQEYTHRVYNDNK